jgi:hypothetical protein
VTAPDGPPFSPNLIAPAEGKTVALFGVRFRYKVESADSANAASTPATVIEILSPAGMEGSSIQSSWMVRPYSSASW